MLRKGMPRFLRKPKGDTPPYHVPAQSPVNKVECPPSGSLPMSLQGDLVKQCQKVRYRHEKDIRKGGGFVPLPDVLANKVPYAETDWRWQFLFPSMTMVVDKA